MAKDNAKETKASKDTEKSQKKSNAKAGSEKKKGGIKQYFKELRAEMKKVVWPTKKQVANNTGVVLVVMAAMGLFLFAVDTGLGAAIQALLNIGR
ncbi:MAG: preprotein translocase subunit SecE [Ruminococcus sp.]|nr:preprotein translocase subunit SecE [Ruminococcus sp.]